MAWWDYVQRVSGGANQSEIADKTGMTQSSVNRWKTAVPKPASVARFANAYRRPILEAFVAAGFISEEDAQLVEVPADLSEVSNEDLLAEVTRRMGLKFEKASPED